MSRRTNNRSTTTAKTIEFPAKTPTVVIRRYPIPARPGNSHHTTTTPMQHQQQQDPNHSPVPELTTSELYRIFFDHLRADPAIRDKAIQILQTIEAEQQKKAAAQVCPTCLRPYAVEPPANNNHNKEGKRTK